MIVAMRVSVNNCIYESKFTDVENTNMEALLRARLFMATFATKELRLEDIEDEIHSFVEGLYHHIGCPDQEWLTAALNEGVIIEFALDLLQYAQWSPLVLITGAPVQ